LLTGDASKARRVLAWEPTYTFKELIKEMVASDLEATPSGPGDFERKGAKVNRSCLTFLPLRLCVETIRSI
jgi:hypothetical protein